MSGSTARHRVIVVLTPIITAFISMVGTLGAAYFGIIRADHAQMTELKNRLEQLGQEPSTNNWKISLTVLDENKEPLRNVFISLLPPSFQGLTDDSGTWTFNNVPAGTYSLWISPQIDSLPPHRMIDATARGSVQDAALSAIMVRYNIDHQQPN